MALNYLSRPDSAQEREREERKKKEDEEKNRAWEMASDTSYGD